MRARNTFCVVAILMFIATIVFIRGNNFPVANFTLGSCVGIVSMLIFTQPGNVPQRGRQIVTVLGMLVIILLISFAYLMTVFINNNHIFF